MACVLLLTGCARRDHLPDVDTPEYREVVRNFYSAAARIQTGSEAGAQERLVLAADVAPGEPAIWYNMAVLSLRRGEADEAASHAATAREKDKNNGDILLLSGLIELQRENRREAIRYLNASMRADSNNVRSIYALAKLASGEEKIDIDASSLIDSILERYPGNTAALIEAIRLSIESGNGGQAVRHIASLNSLTADWDADVRTQMESLNTAFNAGQPDETVLAALMRVSNVMKSVEAHRANLAQVDVNILDPGLVMTRFVRLATPSGRPSPPDSTLSFEPEPLMPADTRWQWLGSVFLSSEGPLAVVAVSPTSMRIEPRTVLPFPGSTSATLPEHPVAFFDFDYDFRMDIAAAGRNGLRIYRQNSDGSFSDRTRSTGLAERVTADAYTGVWAIDVDLEGDMDLIAATRNGPIRLLQNNGDGTFSARSIFAKTSDLRDLAWADLDDDGDPDAALLDRSGNVHLYVNERSGFFEHRPVVGERVAATPAQTMNTSEAQPRVAAITVADIDGDGLFEILAMQEDGRIVSVKDANRTATRTVIVDTGLQPQQVLFARIATADLDNNGGSDLIASVDQVTAIWLRTENNTFIPSGRIEARVHDEPDLNANGNLSLISLDQDGTSTHHVNRSERKYLSRSILPKAADGIGDRRINSFGIGGEIELRTDLLYQKRPITSPIVHFGLGDRELVDVARIDWPNGTSQASFDLATDQALIATQSLKGSCPWVFTFDGDSVRFVTDFLWRSPLGLRINAVETAGIATTEDWVKIDGDELAARDGVYDVRITAELWETHFFDHVRMEAIDHPRGTEVFVNEVFVFPPPELAVHVTRELQTVRRAWDGDGTDVTVTLSFVDETYVDSFELYSHQGLARENRIEADLGEIPAGMPLWLIASGWIRPTDSSINVALGQGSHPRPQGIRLDVLNDDGTWTTVHPDVGFPAGKAKTMLIDLTGAFDSRAARRIRLTTNLEIYWDALQWAEALDPGKAVATELALAKADLSYRGFSQVLSSRRSQPETPAYDSLAATGPRWRDLVGYHTRFGDVSELLVSVDDRYVIMNAGDELALAFTALPPPKEGWTRDFILIGDGWVKDGDYNTTFSKTVLPLPDHAATDYRTSRPRLVDNAAYREHSDDWVHYHTRYVTPDSYSRSLRTR